MPVGVGQNDHNDVFAAPDSIIPAGEEPCARDLKAPPDLVRAGEGSLDEFQVSGTQVWMVLDYVALALLGQLDGSTKVGAGKEARQGPLGEGPGGGAAEGFLDIFALHLRPLTKNVFDGHAGRKPRIRDASKQAPGSGVIRGIGRMILAHGLSLARASEDFSPKRPQQQILELRCLRPGRTGG